MQGELQTLVRCGIVGCMGALCCFLLNLLPVGGQAKQGISVGVILVTIALMLRVGGLL